MQDPYSCTRVCRVFLTLEGLAAAIGPAGDSVYVPMRISGGHLSGIGHEKRILGGSDFAVMNAAEMLEHHGHLVAADPEGDILVWYSGASQAAEGAYDDVLDGRLPGRIPCRVSIRIVSTSPQWRSLNGKPLLGVGTFDGESGALDVVVLSVVEHASRN